tara:strand:+ start:845 stop:1603 length:759 start_codon:yes stop_codon:yes gene_type:complete
MTNKLMYFIGNWKMFGDFTSFKIINKINRYISRNKNFKQIKIVFCVPNTLIHFFKKKIKKNSIFLGAQNCHYNEGYGAFTGSVNASMLKKTGAEYIILGHSENRIEGDSDLTIKKKIQSALNQNLKVIFCIGETKKEKVNGKTFLIIKKQLKNSLSKNLDKNKIILAYEPIWSIGSNIIPKPNELRNAIKFIKKNFRDIFKSKKSPKVLYGGSVNHKNISYLSAVDEIDGFLIGGASQSAKKFIDIIKNYYK